MFKILYLPTGEYVRRPSSSRLSNIFNTKQDAKECISSVFHSNSSTNSVPFITAILEYRIKLSGIPGSSLYGKVPEYLLEIVEIVEVDNV